MKAVVLAGGHATRLWPITRDRPKPLLPLDGQPILGYVMDELSGMDGVDEIVVTTNAKFADAFKAFLDGTYDARVLVEGHDSEDEKTGSLGAIVQALDAVGRSDDLLVVGGDNYASLDLSAFVAAARDREGVTMACYTLDDPADASAFGVVEADDSDRIVGFEEKPEQPQSRMVSTALYYFDSDVLSMFDAYRAAFADDDSVDHLDETGLLVQWGHDRYPMYAYPFDGDWFDIGTPENYLEAQRVLSGSDTAVLDAETTRITDADLSNVIVFPGAHITDATVKNSIIGADVTVDGRDLEGAVIGDHSTVQ